MRQSFAKLMFIGLLGWPLLPMASEDVPACEAQPASPALIQKLRDLSKDGWAARHAAARLPMMGCNTGDAPENCLQGLGADGQALFPEVESREWSAAWKTISSTKMRFLAQVDFDTNYWIRSSPDGRFLAMSYLILDLESVARGSEPRQITTLMPYDPAFFPDNSAINYAGGSFCPLAFLKEPSRTQLNFDEAGCNRFSQIGLYQSLGASLNGTDYLAAAGPFNSEVGYAAPGQGQPETPFGETSYIDLSPMIFNGAAFEIGSRLRINVPYEGDWQLGPSGQTAVSRTAGQSAQAGYAVHMLHGDPIAGQISISTEGRFCATGGKAAASFDERFLVFHHSIEPADFLEYGFSSAEDPEFQRLIEQGVSNIYIHDLYTGETRRVTNMAGGQFAYFPHFRADGWIYFVVKIPSQRLEHFVASDFAIRISKSRPLR